MKIRALVFAVAVCGNAAAESSPYGSAESKALVEQGYTLSVQGKRSEALEKFKEAAKLSPEASFPISSIATLLYDDCGQRKAEQQKECYDQSRGMAQQALSLWSNDPLAHEVLRRLSGEPLAWQYQPVPEAAKLQIEAEVLFNQHKFDEAYAKYMAAIAADPRFARAWIYAGDCFFFRQQWAEAEKHFRKAVEIDPRDSMGWRFLVDALARQGKRREAGLTAVRAVAAHPGQKANWDRVQAYEQAEGTPLQALGLRIMATGVSKDKDGKPKVELAESLSKLASDNLDFGIWVGYALSKANATEGSPFAREYEAWLNGFKVAAEIEEKKGGKVYDPALRTMRQLYTDGQLKASILLLTYRESYRTELDAWLAEEPQGAKAFIDRYHLMPQ